MSQTWIGQHPNDGREYDCQCARCGSSLMFDECESCGGEGTAGHDCGEDCCACLHPEENIDCDYCNGEGHYPHCLSASSGWCRANPKPGRENIEPSTPEWYAVESEARP